VGALAAIVVANGDIVAQGLRIAVPVANKVLAPAQAQAQAQDQAQAQALLLLGPVLEELQSIPTFMPLGIVHYPTRANTELVAFLQKVVMPIAISMP